MRENGQRPATHVLAASWQPPPLPPTTQQTWPPAFKARPPRQGPPPDEKVARGAKRAKKAVEILGLTSEDAAGAAAATAGDTAAERAKADGKSPEEVAAAACPHFTDKQNVTLVSPSVTADTSLLPPRQSTVQHSLTTYQLSCVLKLSFASHRTTSTMLPTLLEKPVHHIAQPQPCFPPC